MKASGGYGSEFEECPNKRKSTWRNDEISKKFKSAGSNFSSKMPSRSSYVDSYEKEEKKLHFAQFLSMSAYARHQKLVHDYLNYYGGKMEDFKRSSENDKTDYDVIKENHRFVWDDDEEDSADTWGKRLAKKYYDKLFKEYCICDLSRYKENKVAMRWRIAKEVQEGKGQFICGARKCEALDGLKTWEVNFGYMEHGEKKNTLIKLRLCKSCSKKLNYHHKHKRVKKKKLKSLSKKKKDKKKKRHNKRRSSSSEEKSSSVESDHEESNKAEPTQSSSKQSSTDINAENIWKKPVEVEIEKTREEEFEDYIQDLFM